MMMTNEKVYYNYFTIRKLDVNWYLSIYASHVTRKSRYLHDCKRITWGTKSIVTFKLFLPNNFKTPHAISNRFVVFKNRGFAMKYRQLYSTETILYLIFLTLFLCPSWAAKFNNAGPLLVVSNTKTKTVRVY